MLFQRFQSCRNLVWPWRRASAAARCARWRRWARATRTCAACCCITCTPRWQNAPAGLPTCMRYTTFYFTTGTVLTLALNRFVRVNFIFISFRGIFFVIIIFGVGTGILGWARRPGRPYSYTHDFRHQILRDYTNQYVPIDQKLRKSRSFTDRVL